MEHEKNEPNLNNEYVLTFNKKDAERFSSKDADKEIEQQAQKDYSEVVKDIVKASIVQLDFQNDGKKDIRRWLLVFFMLFLGLQFVSLLALLFCKGLIANFSVSDTVLLSFIGSVFVETLGAVIIMIKFAFDSKQENTALKILHGVIDKYQKH